MQSVTEQFDAVLLFGLHAVASGPRLSHLLGGSPKHLSYPLMNDAHTAESRTSQ